MFEGKIKVEMFIKIIEKFKYLVLENKINFKLEKLNLYLDIW